MPILAIFFYNFFLNIEKTEKKVKILPKIIRLGKTDVIIGLSNERKGD